MLARCDDTFVFLNTRKTNILMKKEKSIWFNIILTVNQTFRAIYTCLDYIGVRFPIVTFSNFITFNVFSSLIFIVAVDTCLLSGLVSFNDFRLFLILLHMVKASLHVVIV